MQKLWEYIIMPMRQQGHFGIPLYIWVNDESDLWQNRRYPVMMSNKKGENDESIRKENNAII